MELKLRKHKNTETKRNQIRMNRSYWKKYRIRKWLQNRLITTSFALQFLSQRFLYAPFTQYFPQKKRFSLLLLSHQKDQWLGMVAGYQHWACTHTHEYTRVEFGEMWKRGGGWDEAGRRGWMEEWRIIGQFSRQRKITVRGRKCGTLILTGILLQWHFLIWQKEMLHSYSSGIKDKIQTTCFTSCTSKNFPFRGPAIKLLDRRWGIQIFCNSFVYVAVVFAINFSLNQYSRTSPQLFHTWFLCMTKNTLPQGLKEIASLKRYG